MSQTNELNVQDSLHLARKRFDCEGQLNSAERAIDRPQRNHVAEILG